MIMDESPNNNTVLHRLLAERRLMQGGNKELSSLSSSNSGSHCDLSTALPLQETVSSPKALENEQLYPHDSKVSSDRTPAMQNAIQAPAVLSSKDVTSAARLDALCRSTLEKPSNFAGSFSNSVGNQTPSSDPIKSKPVLKGPTTRSASRELLFRLRKDMEAVDKIPRVPPTYNEAKAEAERMKDPEFRYCDPTNALISPRYMSFDSIKGKHTTGSRSYPLLDSDYSLKNSNRPEFQLHGHPKSSSGGDEYFYTDQLRKNNQRRGIRSKKHKNGLGRSSSLRHTPEETIHEIYFSSPTCSATKPSNDQKPSLLFKNMPGPITNRNERGAVMTKHVSSRSAPSQNTEEGIHIEKRRSSLHGNLHCLAEDIQSNFSKDQSLENHNSSKIVSCDSATDMHQHHQDLNHVSTPNNPATYHRGIPGAYGQGQYYGGLTSHSALGQSSSATPETNGGSHTPILNALGGNSPPRPPPPPYPGQYNDLDPPLAQNSSVDSPSWNPQRPNSLALGKSSKRKSLNNSGGAQNSPCLTSPTSVKSFTPLARGTPFYSNVKESPHMTPNGQVYVSTLNSPHQLQTSNGSSSYLKRSGSGNIVALTSSSSGSSTCTAVTTPAFQDAQYVDPGLRSPAGPGRYPLQGFSQELYGSSSGVSKSDSMNSASSSTTSGSGASRIGRRKRNSSKPGFGSGSSSNSGSRPNSMADLADRLESENENLRTCLDATKQKLKRFENLQVELQLITQSHQALQQTASNRERLEMEMRNQLTAELEKTKSERDSFKEQVSSLTEKLKNMPMTSSNNDAVNVTRVNNAADSSQAKTRKLIERERELEDELEEYKERISELNIDMELLTSSLHKAQTTITVLKEKFLQNDSVDSYTEQLSKSLASLQKIVDERQEIEKELKERLSKQLQAQRPLKSTSSNDEGISEMDPPESANSSSVDVYSSREGQMLGAKAEMLKWQHRYLEHGLLKHVHSNGSEATQHKHLYKALRNHRHTVSDPGFDKNSHVKTILCGMDNNSSSVPLYEQESLHQSSSSLATCSKSEIGAKEQIQKDFNSACMTADCACQTPTSGWILGGGGEADCEKGKDDSLTKSSVEDTNASSNNNVVDADSPSEGYHSQQSSGSPTPSAEKHTLHFTTSGDGVLTNSRETRPGVFRRNRSADVLTTSHI